MDVTAKSHKKEMIVNHDNLRAQLSEFCAIRLGLGRGPWLPPSQPSTMHVRPPLRGRCMVGWSHPSTELPQRFHHILV